MRINHNTMALNAWRNLTANSGNMQTSLEKLSSGYRINRAADDPAGLVISEKLRAEITGIGQAINNTQDATSMVQVAEGSLVEINSMLNSMRALALHAANTGASSADAIAADQQQIDSAVDSIASIATNSSYLGRYLLNGSSGNTASVVDSTNIAAVTAGSSPAGTTYANVAITASATRAAILTASQSTSLSASTVTGGSLTINGVSIAIATATTISAAVATINQTLNAAGITNIVAATGASSVTLQNLNYGSDYSINVVDNKSILYVTGTTASVGINVAGTINGSAATGKGLTLTANSGMTYAGTAVTFVSAANTTAAYASAFKVDGNAVSFQVGSNTTEKQVVNLQNVGPDQLGVKDSSGNALATNGLLDIKTGAAYELKTDAGTALKVIDAAISSISNTRASLGALTKNVLETKVRSLQISNENLTASESRIRDVDMASEMMQFTKSQIMMQASTSMLAQANTAPQAILQLLKG